MNDVSRFKYCHFNEVTGLMWCRHHNGTWAPPFTIGPKGSSDEFEDVKTSSADQGEDEVNTNSETI